MGVGTLQNSLEAQASLTQTLLGGQLQQVDQAMQTAKVGMQMGVKAQEMATAQAVVAQMTGVGQQLNITV